MSAGAVSGVVSFTTDYGLADGFVAACHGVILRAVPAARIIDVTHLVPAGDIRRAAAVLAQTVPALPVAAVHLGVVDPGVGTARRALVLRAVHGWLVGPDNGLLIAAADRLGGIDAAVALPVPPGTPATFHGRDVFAPATAALLAGRDLAELGEPCDPATLVRLPSPHVRLGPDGGLEAEVVQVDVFGNVQLAATGQQLGDTGLVPGAHARLRRLPVDQSRSDVAWAAAVVTTFGSVPPGALLVYVDAAGMAAVAVRDAHAASRLALAPGDRLTLSPVTR
ncbi:SAM-dependent chlorinase/fluorinase [Frankia sp. R82]|uniref:SAM hydrolase/SAM-dependent halogenase family protein n=1 Tax=Frankia sp. R82 TaxID=2950553 RepID=UPI0020442266|nr:SAM-dependent chlorinase/fluorinase [Frankia sp. R82]MCM3884495.1 SAM-dependent chlorinase/fluorinase [Frankia sp. R82]